jgi:hypothetical protein
MARVGLRPVETTVVTIRCAGAENLVEYVRLEADCLFLALGHYCHVYEGDRGATGVMRGGGQAA